MENCVINCTYIPGFCRKGSFFSYWMTISQSTDNQLIVYYSGHFQVGFPVFDDFTNQKLNNGFSGKYTGHPGVKKGMINRV